jgi:hypothetical protein
VHGGDSIGCCAVYKAHTLQAVQLRDVHDVVVIFGVGRDPLPAY